MMKKITFKLFLSCVLCLPTLLFAQNKNAAPKEKCYSDTYNAKLLESYPNMMGSEAFRLNLQQRIENARNSGSKMPLVTIPVVIHVLHNGEPIGTGPNLSDEQLLSQITVLNEDFRNMAGTPGQSTAGGVDVEVNFVMAQQTPSGCPTNGINRVNICQDGTDGAAVDNWKAQTIWDRDLYMNMWSSKYVGDLNGILGFAQFPGGPANTDGVSAGHTFFGSSDYDTSGTFTLNPPYDKGRTMTHEVGHYLGLFHTFQGGCAGAGDGIADTPAVATPNYGCTANTSCGSADMIENYMDYTDDTCMNTYTAGQKVVVQNVLAGSRVGLTTSNGATPPASVANDVAIAVESTNVSCGTEINPAVIITNWGTSMLTAATISYDLDGGSSTNFSWTGALAYGESETVTLPTMTSTAGDHDINVSVTTSGDARACNDTDSNCFTLTATSGPCTSVANTDYATSTTDVIINDGTTDILSNLDTGKPSGYTNYSGTIAAVDMTQGSAYTLSTSINTDGAYTCVTTAWIDWNQNCNFEAGEEFDMGSANNVADGLTSNSPYSFNVPSDAVIGNTVLRVVTKFNSAPGACENGHDAEVEDYDINVLSALSVDEFSLNGVSIYPNPTSNTLNISLANTNNLPDGYAIYNMLGQLVKERRISSVEDLTVNTSSYSNGMYFIKISDNNNVATISFIKE